MGRAGVEIIKDRLPARAREAVIMGEAADGSRLTTDQIRRCLSVDPLADEVILLPITPLVTAVGKAISFFGNSIL